MRSNPASWHMRFKAKQTILRASSGIRVVCSHCAIRLYICDRCHRGG